jgi:hypothetical protein
VFTLVACGADAAPPSAPPPVTTLADLVAVNQVAVYQGAKVTIADEEAVVANPNAPVIPSRPAYMRIHARRRLAQPGAPPATVGPLVARLTVSAEGVPDVVLSDGPKRLAVLDDAAVTSTFNFELKAEQVRAGASYAVDLVDPSGAWDGVAHFPPVDEKAPLRVGPLAPTLKVRFVPVRYQADGSSRLSPLDRATVDAYRDALYKLYPASKVEISVRSELAWPATIAANGDGWDQLLSAIIETRSDDDVPDDVYYVGIFNPAATEHEYCSKSDRCVLGVAPASYRGEADLRVAMIVGYPSEHTHGTLAQEIAHAMGRYHAPCGEPAAVDTKFPYADGGIGTWGYDVLARKLISPSQRVFDFMSYCAPVWVSDYTFAGLYKNMVEVDAKKRPPTLSQQRIKSYRVAADGTLAPGPTMRVSGGSVELRETIAERPLRGRFLSTPEIGGGYWLPDEPVPLGTRLMLSSLSK